MLSQSICMLCIYDAMSVLVLFYTYTKQKAFDKISVVIPASTFEYNFGA